MEITLRSIDFIVILRSDGWLKNIRSHKICEKQEIIPGKNTIAIISDLIIWLFKILYSDWFTSGPKKPISGPWCLFSVSGTVWRIWKLSDIKACRLSVIFSILFVSRRRLCAEIYRRFQFSDTYSIEIKLCFFGESFIIANMRTDIWSAKKKKFRSFFNSDQKGNCVLINYRVIELFFANTQPNWTNNVAIHNLKFWILSIQFLALFSDIYYFPLISSHHCLL